MSCCFFLHFIVIAVVVLLLDLLTARTTTILNNHLFLKVLFLCYSNICSLLYCSQDSRLDKIYIIIILHVSQTLFNLFGSATWSTMSVCCVASTDSVAINKDPYLIFNHRLVNDPNKNEKWIKRKKIHSHSLRTNIHGKNIELK